MTDNERELLKAGDEVIVEFKDYEYRVATVMDVAQRFGTDGQITPK